jgi:hypothetical protein
MQRTKFLKINECRYARYEHAYVENYPTSKTVLRIFYSIKRIAISFERKKSLERHDFFWFGRKNNLCNFSMIFITERLCAFDHDKH